MSTQTPTSKVADLNIEEIVPLRPPRELMAEIPRSEAQAEFVAMSRETISRILLGEDPRFLVICGPCSIHDTEAGLEYARRFQALAAEVSDSLYLVMRVYFEKPRTTLGWKGLIMDPQMDGTADIPTGLVTARRFLSDVIDLGVPTATELLDPITPQYIADLIAWTAIGARTTESQTHRQMASGLSMPVGFKNTTSGSVKLAVNAVRASIQPQTFLGVSPDGTASMVSTSGNPGCHIILRGGDHGPNHDAESIANARRSLREANLPDHLIIDASHANCGKDHRQMPDAFRTILKQRAQGDSGIAGVMLESNLVAGNQKLGDDPAALTCGQSITDQCIDWETTESLILEAHAACGGKP